ncbi:MAG: hypothetical protein R2873_34480 [Caldilineaceae bacterium]
MIGLRRILSVGLWELGVIALVVGISAPVISAGSEIGMDSATGQVSAEPTPTPESTPSPEPTTTPESGSADRVIIHVVQEGESLNMIAAGMASGLFGAGALQRHQKSKHRACWSTIAYSTEHRRAPIHACVTTADAGDSASQRSYHRRNLQQQACGVEVQVTVRRGDSI